VIEEALDLSIVRSTGLTPDAPELTPREREVLELLARGCTNRQMLSGARGRSAYYRRYVRAVLAKLGLTRKAQAAVGAARRQPQVG
jgi:DNA-binding CsgD family transcriptional regulator